MVLEEENFLMGSVDTGASLNPVEEGLYCGSENIDVFGLRLVSWVVLCWVLEVWWTLTGGIGGGVHGRCDEKVKILVNNDTEAYKINVKSTS